MTKLLSEHYLLMLKGIETADGSKLLVRTPEPDEFETIKEPFVFVLSFPPTPTALGIIDVVGVNPNDIAALRDQLTACLIAIGHEQAPEVKGGAPLSQPVSDVIHPNALGQTKSFLPCPTCPDTVICSIDCNCRIGI
ncbi:MAG: hypothetical protein WAX89_08330 [Alphaproteobacteria bacterium]